MQQQGGPSLPTGREGYSWSPPCWLGPMPCGQFSVTETDWSNASKVHPYAAGFATQQLGTNDRLLAIVSSPVGFEHGRLAEPVNPSRTGLLAPRTAGSRSEITFRAPATRRGFTECFPTSGLWGWRRRIAHGSAVGPCGEHSRFVQRGVSKRPLPTCRSALRFGRRHPSFCRDVRGGEGCA
jgi:hypothetical protein